MERVVLEPVGPRAQRWPVYGPDGSVTCERLQRGEQSGFLFGAGTPPAAPGVRVRVDFRAEATGEARVLELGRDDRFAAPAVAWWLPYGTEPGYVTRLWVEPQGG